MSGDRESAQSIRHLDFAYCSTAQYTITSWPQTTQRSSKPGHMSFLRQNISLTILTGNSWASPEASSRTSSHVAIVVQTSIPAQPTHIPSQRIRTLPPRNPRIHLRPSLAPPNRRAQPHPSPDLNPQQPQTARARQSLRPPLQHGAGEREGNVERDAAQRGWQEGQADQPRSLHQQAFLAR
jgi:hypothetical protein